MTLFRDKVQQLLEYPRDILEVEADAFVARAADWPTTTQVPLRDVAFLLAALLTEPDPSVRRVTVTDAMRIGDRIG